MSADGLHTAPVVRASEDPSVLASIDQPGVQLAIWQRSIARTRAADLARLHGGPGRWQVTLRGGEPITEIIGSGELRLAGAVQDAAREVIEVYGRLAAARGLATLPIRIEAIEARVCRRFHVDHVGLRMLCTLYGAGTEWLPEAAADRTQLGAGGGEVLRDPTAIQSLIAGDIAILKGHCHRADPGLGLIHRSPDASAARPRLLLAADLPA
jgi:hypothetical protein